MDLVGDEGAVVIDTCRRAKAPAVLLDGFWIVAHAKAQIERGVRAAAHAALARRESEPGRPGQEAGGRPPESDGRAGRIDARFGREHAGHFALGWALAQGLCALLLAAGCARVPAAGTGAEARARFLDSFGAQDAEARGAGMLSVRSGSEGRAGLNTRWAARAESVVVVAYVGPVRALDATILGESVYVALRTYEVGLAGPVREEDGLGARGLRFLTRPWEFGSPWIREAIERAEVESIEKGWRLRGDLETATGTRPFRLDLNRKLEPTALLIQREPSGGSYVSIRYGPIRRFDAGRAPRWIEWSHADTRIRLDVEEIGELKPGPLRRVPPAKDGWTILGLGDPQGRDLLKRFLGVGGAETPR